MKHIILSSRPLHLSPDFIVIDCGTPCIWLGEDRCVAYSTYKHVRFRIIALLLLSIPNLVTHEKFRDYVYGDDPAGGPLGPQNTISVTLNHATPFFTLCGLERENRHGWGYLLRWKETT